MLKMITGSLFSGIGGFDLAFRNVGMETAWQVEIDKNCLNILERHFPESERYEDVKTVGRRELKSVDIITGGFPCQDLSVAGKRAGLAGERSGLWYEFARIIEELRPRWVIIENVPGLLSSNKGRDFAIILQKMVELGYGVCWRVLDAQYFGVPQRRRRVFVVGSLGNGGSAEVLFESESVQGSITQSRKVQKDVAYTLAGGSNKCHTDIGSGQQDRNLVCMATGQSNAEINYNKSTTLSCAHEQPILWQMNHASEVYREGANQNVSPTLQERMGTGGNNVPLVGVRRFTPVECERLQGFPDGWTDVQSNAVRYRQLGNAVAVPVIEWIARRIIDVESRR